jgi:hypothetical protein
MKPSPPTTMMYVSSWWDRSSGGTKKWSKRVDGFVAGVPKDSGAVNTADSPVDLESAIDGAGENRPKPERQSISKKNVKERKSKTNMICFTSNSVR